jgi:hypothetical protein
MESSGYFFDKAEQCRLMAAAVISPTDPVIAALLTFAAQFEVKAIKAANRENDVSERHPRR